MIGLDIHIGNRDPFQIFSLTNLSTSSLLLSPANMCFCFLMGRASRIRLSLCSNKFCDIPSILEGVQAKISMFSWRSFQSSFLSHGGSETLIFIGWSGYFLYMNSWSSWSHCRLSQRSNYSESVIWLQRGAVNRTHAMIPTPLGVKILIDPWNVEEKDLIFLKPARPRMMLYGEGSRTTTNSGSIVFFTLPLYSSSVRGRVMMPRGPSECPSKLMRGMKDIWVLLLYLRENVGKNVRISPPTNCHHRHISCGPEVCLLLLG